MHLDHLALWTDDIDRLTHFYATYFGARPGVPYTNAAKGFESCFLSFDGGARIELMKTTTLALLAHEHGALRGGLTHFCLSTGDESQVDALTQRLRIDGFTVLDGPRRTGDGYYESVILDPDGNRVEISA
jgi:lactoylglutathione lyase